jgi:hypothetical protein
MAEKQNQLKAAKGEQKTADLSRDPKLIQLIFNVQAEIELFKKENEFTQERTALQIKNSLREPQHHEIPKPVAQEAQIMRHQAKTEITEARNKAFRINRAEKAAQNAEEYMDIRDKLKSQKRNLALKQH